MAFFVIWDIYKPFNMKIRNPFKDKFLRWRDDITSKEKTNWLFIFVAGGMLSARLINWIKALILSLLAD